MDLKFKICAFRLYTLSKHSTCESCYHFCSDGLPFPALNSEKLWTPLPIHFSQIPTFDRYLILAEWKFKDWLNWMSYTIAEQIKEVRVNLTSLISAFIVFCRYWNCKKLLQSHCNHEMHIWLLLVKIKLVFVFPQKIKWIKISCWR